MYGLIEAIEENGGVRVRLHTSSGKVQDFLYRLEKFRGGGAVDRVAKFYGQPQTSIRLVTEFQK